MTNHRIVAVCGSLADDSGTRTALREALDAAAGAGARTTLVDLREYDLPTFDADRPDAGDAPALRAELRAADGVLLGTPMYHGSYASPLKTALDYSGFDEFEATTVGLLAVSGGGFPTPALGGLRSVARALDAWVLPLQVGVPNSGEQFTGDGIVDDDLRERVRRLGVEVHRYAGVERYPELASCAERPAPAD
jgi:NAD(P)H-dependent FMN reductase